MNIRKFLCRFFHRWHWFHRAVKCEQFDPQSPPPTEYISIKVCTVSGLLPNAYCPKTKEGQFIKGQEPKTKCTTHMEPPPTPKPEKSKRSLIVFIPDYLTARGDKKRFNKTLYENGVTARRSFLTWPWGDGREQTPFKKIGIWNHPTSHQTFPLYRLDNWDESYFDKLRAMGRDVYETEQDLYLTLTYIRQMDKTEKYYSPFYCSEEALDPASTGGVYGECLKKYHAKLAKRAISELLDFGVSLYIEPANEFSELGWATKDGKPEVPIRWYQWFVETILSYGIAKNRLIHSGWKDAVFNQPGIFSQHCIVKPDKMPTFPNPKKILISGDGGFDGDGDWDLARDGTTRRYGLGEGNAKLIAAEIVKDDFYGMEYMSRKMYQKDRLNANLDDFNPAPIKPMLRIFNG